MSALAVIVAVLIGGFLAKKFSRKVSVKQTDGSSFYRPSIGIYIFVVFGYLVVLIGVYFDDVQSKNENFEILKSAARFLVPLLVITIWLLNRSYLKIDDDYLIISEGLSPCKIIKSNIINFEYDRRGLIVLEYLTSRGVKKRKLIGPFYDNMNCLEKELSQIVVQNNGKGQRIR